MTVDLAGLLVGRLSAAERIWSAAAPALLMLAYFALAGLVYGARRLVRGPFRDEEMDAREGGALTTRGLRHFFAWTMRPFWMVLARVRFPPNVITSLSLALALGAGIGVAAGRFALGGWLFVAAGVLDFLDGRVARSTGQASPSGAALDSILDRYVESALIVGLAWYYRHDWVLAACLLALTGSLLVPYVRARGESLGVKMNDVGFMQRPERMLVLGAGTALSPIVEVLLSPADPNPPHRLAVAALVILAVTSHATALQRLRGLIQHLEGKASRLSARPLKSAVSNGVATALDAAIAAALVYSFSGDPRAATALGSLAGAIVSFTLSRVWAFEAQGAAPMPQLARYAFASLSTAALNVGGVALFAILNVPFPIGWVLTRAVVFSTWSYPLQRDFVFAHVEPTIASRP
jgi:phosphatidylglycerophosphate synthase/putative flippase GtrA